MTDFERLRGVIEEGMEAGLHLGAVVHVRQGGEVVADFAMGRAGLWPSADLRVDHRLLWLSAGKPLTALAVAILQERGQLRFEDYIADYIPDFARHGKGGITIEHVLMQAHGFKPPRLDWPRWTREEVVAAICDAPMASGAVPGEHAAYDPQAGWYLLAEITKQVSGRENHDFVREEILIPLGCESASIGLPEEEWLAGVERGEIAVLHDTNGTARDKMDLRRESLSGDGEPEGGRRVPGPWVGDDGRRAAARNPGGGSLGCAADLARVYECLLAGGKTADGEVLLRRETVQAMTSRRREGLKDHTFGQVVDWGLGFLINSAKYGALANPYGYGKHASEDTFGHGGMQSSGGFADPRHGLCGAIIFNGLPGEPKHQRRIDGAMTALYEDLGLGR